MAAVTVNSIQKSSDSWLTTESYKDITITSVDTSKTIVEVSVLADGGGFDDYSFAAELTSSTNVRITRGATGATATTILHVVEFGSGVSVQRGSHTMTSTSDDVTISSVTTSKSFVLMRMYDSGFNTAGDKFVTGDITSSTNLRLQTGSSGDTEAVWQVVEVDNCSVQKVSKTRSTSSATENDTISSVTMAKTLLFPMFRNNETASQVLDTERTTVRLTSSTNIEYERFNASVSFTENVITYVVSFTDEVSVQRGEMSLASATTTVNVTISSVDTDYSWPLTEGTYCGYRARQDSNVNTPSETCFTNELTSSTNLRMVRDDTDTDTVICPWQVAEFPSAAAVNGDDHAIRRGMARGILRGIESR